MSASDKDNPATAGFWDLRFRKKVMPWDAGAVPPELARQFPLPRYAGSVLIPGCGSAYEARFFAEKGFDVVAIDFSAEAVAQARAQLGDLQHMLVQGDFFSYDFGAQPFDVVYERAFLAAIPRTLWPAYAARMPALLRPGGQLLGFFVHGEQEGGPPFNLKSGELEALLAPSFDKTGEAAVGASLAVFEGKERWEVWSRKAAA